MKKGGEPATPAHIVLGAADLNLKQGGFRTDGRPKRIKKPKKLLFVWVGVLELLLQDRNQGQPCMYEYVLHIFSMHDEAVSCPSKIVCLLSFKVL